MHGAGNDFIIIHDEVSKDYSHLASVLCRRHFSIGADGLMVVDKKSSGGVDMRYYNSDGSIGEMCGNGARCLAMYAYNNSLVDSDEFYLYTLSGKVHSKIINSSKVRIAMGKPVYNSHFENYFFNDKIDVSDREFIGSYILMGVPHLTIELDELDKNTLLKYGPLLEHHKFFNRGTNVNFVKVLNVNEIEIDTWERGAGNTLACGTGALASVFSLFKTGRVSSEVEVHAPGGLLKVYIDKNEDVVLEGGATTVFEGIFKEDFYD